MEKNILTKLKELKDKDHIIVTGPARSGTTITMRIISDLCGHKIIESSDGNGNSDVDIMAYSPGEIRKLMKWRKKLIFHSPHNIAWMNSFPGAFIVFVKRNKEDVLNSMDRVGWRPTHQSRFMKMNIKKEDYKKFDEMSYPEQVEFYWDKYIKPHVDYLEVNYEELKGYPLFIPKEKRRVFKARQWTI